MSDRQDDVEAGYQREVRNGDNFEYDVFIIFCEEDKQMANYVCDGLENHTTKPQRCLASWKPEAFTPGRPTFDCIKSCMMKSKRTLLILTKESLAPPTAENYKNYRGWLTLETILALERSQQINSLILRFLLCDVHVNQKELEFLKKGMLEHIPRIAVTFNVDNWADQMVTSLDDEIQVPDIMPVGCLAYGQVFSHFVGYLSYMLPALDEAMKKTRIYREKPGHVSTKYYLLLPASSKAQSTLECYDQGNNITVEKYTEKISIEVVHAGKKRDMNLTIYCARKGSEEYYFVADFPMVLNAIHKMHHLQLAEVDIRHQIARFYYALNEVINHTANVECNDTVKILPYNELYETLADVVFCAARDDVIAARQDAQGEGHGTMTVGRTPQRLLSKTDVTDSEYDAVIIHFDHLTQDRKVADEIRTCLEKHNLTVAPGFGKSEFQHIAEGKWIIFIISKTALQDRKILCQCMAALTDSFERNTLRVLPILVDVSPEEVPDFIKWVTLLSINEPAYCLKLLQVMKGCNIKMEQRLPAGDVATGLAWAYVINYLPVTLSAKTQSDFRRRIRKFLQENQIKCACIEKLYIIIPKSYKTHPNVAEKANERLKPGEIPLTHLGTIEPVKMNAGGQHGREYKLHMFQFTSNAGRTTCFITEYCTPANCLYDMATLYPFAGLQDMHKQSELFVEKLQNIVNRTAVKEKLGDVSGLVELINYDDENMTLMEAFEQKIKFDEVPIRNLVFAEDARLQGDPRNVLPSICDAFNDAHI